MIRKCAACAICLAFICASPAFSGPEDGKPEARPTVHRVLGKSRDIYSLAFSPDDKQLLAGIEVYADDQNDQIEEWNVEAGKVSRNYDPGHSGQIHTITYSESGRYLAIGHLDGFVSIRDSKGAVVLSFMSLEGLGQTLEHVSITEDERGAFVHTVVGRHIAQTRSIPAGRTQIYYIPSDIYSIDGAAMPRNTPTLVCCSPLFLKVFKNRDYSSGNEMKSFKVLREPVVQEVAVSDDASMALLTRSEGDLSLFDLKKDKLIKCWKDHEDPTISTILPFHSRNWFATGNCMGEVEVWDDKGNLRALLKKKGEEGSIIALAITRDNRFLASSGKGRPIIIWDLQPLLNGKE